MKQTSNLGLALYDKTDLMNITGLENSLNHNMELIDSEINQLSVNKAPAGFGLGTVATYLTDLNDLNTIGKGGWYWWTSLVPQNALYPFCTMRVDPGELETGSYSTQTVYYIGQHTGAKMRRYNVDGEWQPWEWENPPMISGVEYRTTERHLGNPVYKKMDSNGVIWWSTDQANWKVEAERVGTYSKTESDTLLAKKVNPNLLDNWYFLNPVNQRGKTTYGSLGANPYTIDRWRTAQTNGDTSTVEVTSNGINIKLGQNNGLEFSQRFEPERLPVVGKIVTLSIDVEGTIYSVTNVVPFEQRIAVGGKTVEFSVRQVTDGDTTFMQVYIMPLFADLLNIHAIKLELGSVSTLANDTPPNYQQELAKCQRYFVRYLDNASSTANIGSGLAYDDKVFACVLPLPVPMRTTPTFSMNGVYVSNERSALTISKAGVSNMVANAVDLAFTTSGLTVGYPYYIKLGGAGCYIDLTADL